VIAFTLRVETPWMYISANADTSAFSLLWKRSKSAVEKLPAAIARDPQLDLAHPGDQTAAVVARPVAAAPLATLSRPDSEQVRHLRLQDLLERLLDPGLEQILVLCNQRF
jgi:hypothetical protein